MPAQTDPYKNFNFLVEIDMVPSAGFSECLIPIASVDVIQYREGGEIATNVRKLPGRTSYSNLVLKRGITSSRDLWTWFKRIVDGVVDKRAVTVVLLDDAKNPVLKWNFRNAWPMKYESSPLHGKGDDIVIETVELAFDSMDIG